MVVVVVATTGRVANLVAIHCSHTAPSWDTQQARHPRKNQPKRRIPLETGSKLTREKTTEGQVPLPVNSVNHPKFDCSNCTRPSRMCFWSCYCMGTLYIGGHNQESLVCHKTQSCSKHIIHIYIYSFIWWTKIFKNGQDITWCKMIYLPCEIQHFFAALPEPSMLRRPRLSNCLIWSRFFNSGEIPPWTQKIFSFTRAQTGILRWVFQMFNHRKKKTQRTRAKKRELSVQIPQEKRFFAFWMDSPAMPQKILSQFQASCWKFCRNSSTNGRLKHEETTSQFSQNDAAWFYPHFSCFNP